MSINPVGLALGAANPGLLPLAFIGGGGGGYGGGGGGRNHTRAILVALLVLGAVTSLAGFLVSGPFGLLAGPVLVAALGLAALFITGIGVLYGTETHSGLAVLAAVICLFAAVFCLMLGGAVALAIMFSGAS